MIRDRDTARRLLAVRVVSEAAFRPGETFILVSPTPESADRLMREIESQVKALSTAPTGGAESKEGKA